MSAPPDILAVLWGEYRTPRRDGRGRDMKGGEWKEGKDRRGGVGRGEKGRGEWEGERKGGRKGKWLLSPLNPKLKLCP